MVWHGTEDPGEQQRQILPDGRVSTTTYVGTTDLCRDTGCYMSSTLSSTTPSHGDRNNITQIRCTVTGKDGVRITHLTNVLLLNTVNYVS